MKRLSKSFTHTGRLHRIVFPRWNAQELLDIKLGKVPYKDVAAWLDDILNEVLDASKNSTLPEKPDHGAIDRLLIQMHREMI